jgi:predicted nucleic acid-binding protein
MRSGPVLGDTICMWALYFRDSKYRGHVLALLRERGLLIPEVCALEAAYPIFRAKGAGELARYALFLENLPLVEGLELIPLRFEDLVRAVELAANEPAFFVDELGNLNLFDAMIAALWERLGAPLATSDRKLVEYGERRGLKAIRLQKEV